MSAPLWSLWSSVWVVPGIPNGHGTYCSQCSGARVLGGEINKDFKVAQKSFAFWTIWRCNASGRVELILDFRLSPYTQPHNY